MLATENGQFNVIVIRNPFDVSDRAILTADFEMKSVAQLLSSARSEVVASLNGGVVPESALSSTYPKPGDSLVICPVPQGSGGKNILRLVAVVALSVVSGGIAAGAAWASGITGVVGTGAMSAAMVQIGGTLLINAVLPPAAPDANAFKYNNADDSPTYGVDGAKNTSVEGVPFPLCYGEHRMAGNIVGLFTENVEDDQYLHMLINAGEGEIEGIHNIQLDDQPLSYFTDVEVRTRTGTADQSSVGWFNRTVIPQSVGVELTQDYVSRNTTSEVDAIRFDIVAPAGLFRIKDSGNRGEHSVEIEVVVESLDLPTPHSEVKSYTLAAKTSSALRRSVMIDNLPESRYACKIRRLSENSEDTKISDNVSVSDINGIIEDPVTYKHTALLALRMRMTNQLSRVPNVSFLHQGIKVKVWNESAQTWEMKASKNPAWIAYDGMTNNRYGGSIPEVSIDLPMFKRWAKFCDQEGLEFNGVIDGNNGLWDALQPVMRVGHAKPVMMGTRYSLSIEMPDEPVMMFSQANIIQDSFNISWLGVEDRANEIEVSYYDRDDNHRQRAVRLYDDDALAKGEVQRLTSFTLLGCTSEEQAHYEAELALNMNKYITQTVTFDAFIDAIACRIGDVVYVQHDMPQWGYSGRVSPGSTVSKLLIQEELGDCDTVLVRSSAQKRYDVSVASVAGEIVYLSGYDGAKRVRRLKTQGGDDIGVLEPIYTAGKGWGVILEAEHAFALTQSVELWDTDIMESRDCWVDADGNINLYQPLENQPEDYADYMAGRGTKVKKPFRILSISGNGEMIRTISAIEYNESMYSKNIPFKKTPNYADLDSLQHSSITGVEESLLSLSAGVDTEITVLVENDDSEYLDTLVEFSKDGGKTFSVAGTARSEVSFMASTGDVLVIRATARSILGQAASVVTAPTTTYSVQGKAAPPGNVQNLAWRVVMGGMELTWDAVPDIDVRGYIVKRGASWDDSRYVNELVQTTNLFVPLTEETSGTYHLRAIDLSDVMSEGVTSVAIGMPTPDTVTGFNAVRNGPQINIVWSALQDSNVMEYEIREGVSWPSSELVAKIAGTSHIVPTLGVGNRTFWIKARHHSGAESNLASFSVVGEHIQQLRNVIMTQDHKGLSWPGVKKGIIEGSGGSDIHMKPNTQFSEYIATVTLPKEYVARNSVEANLLAVSGNSEAFDDLDYPFDDPRAAVAFSGTSDASSVSMTKFIAKRDSAHQRGFHDISLQSDLGDLQGSLTAVAHGISHEPGRVLNGVRMRPTAQASWEVGLPSTFNLTAWHTFKDASTEGELLIWKVECGSGHMTLKYLPATHFWVLEGSDENSVAVTLKATVGTDLLVGIVQTVGQRKLMVGGMSGEYAYGVTDTGTLGPVTKVIMGY